MNLPNWLTCIRILLSFVFVFFLFVPGAPSKGLALFTFLAALLTDYWDVEIARKRGLVTDFGKLMDPIADKLLTSAAFIGFAVMNVIPFWMAGLVLFRDIAITWYRLYFLGSNANAQAAKGGGKKKTVLQYVFVMTVLLVLVLREMAFWSPDWTNVAMRAIYLAMLAIVAVTIWSGLEFIRGSRTAS